MSIQLFPKMKRFFSLFLAALLTVCLPAASSSTLSRFPDRNEVGAWAADSVAAMVEHGYVSGYNDGRLNSKGQITRAEMAQIMCNIFQSVHDSGGITGTCRDTVLVRGAANIHDAVFDGDLILANGLREQELDLNNITVKGRLVVWGGSAVAGVVLPRNDGPVRVAFDAATTEPLHAERYRGEQRRHRRL